MHLSWPRLNFHKSELTDPQVLLERHDLLLLLLQQGTQGSHMLECKLQDHGFLQMTQCLKQEDLR